MPFSQSLRHLDHLDPSGLPALQELRGSRTCQSSDQGALVEQCMAMNGIGAAVEHTVTILEDVSRLVTLESLETGE